MLARPLAAYRATGADSPLGDPARAHGVPLEGYFWRIVHPPSGVVVVALGAVCRNADRSWGLATLAVHPGGFSRTVLTPADAAAPVELKEPAYRVTAALDRPDVDAHGDRVPLRPDMLLRADIVLDRRTLMDWLLNPLLGAGARALQP